MEYRSNSGNLFKKYSTLTGGRNNQPEAPAEEHTLDIISYDQRYKAKAVSTSPEQEPPKQVKVIVHIGGMQHMLSAPDHEGEAYIRAVAEKANRIVDFIREDNPGMAMTNVLTLAVVNAVDQLNRSEQMRLERDTRIEEILIHLDTAKDDYLKQREINWELKKEVLRLKDLVHAQDDEDKAVFAEDEEFRLPLEDLLIRSETEERDEYP